MLLLTLQRFFVLAIAVVAVVVDAVAAAVIAVNNRRLLAASRTKNFSLQVWSPSSNAEKLMMVNDIVFQHQNFVKR